MLGQRAREAANYLPTARNLPGIVSFSPSSHPRDTYPTPSRFPGDRVVPKTRESLSGASSTWTFGAARGQVDAITVTRLGSLSQDALDEDGLGPQYPPHRVPQFGKNPQPDRPKLPTSTNRSKPPISTPAPTADSSPQTGDKALPFRRRRRWSK